MAREPKTPRRLRTTKVLVASLGVATISYALVACDQKGGPVTSGNLMPPLPVDAAPVVDGGAGGTTAPPRDAATGVLNGPPIDAAALRVVTSGNLMPPPEPTDAGPLNKRK